MIAEKPRMTRQIRAYEETARLIEELIRKSKPMRRNKKPTFADVLEEWAQSLYPDQYKVVSEATRLLTGVFPDEGEGDTE